MAAAELLTELDTRFFADNLLTSEDWDACLYDYVSSEGVSEEEADFLLCLGRNEAFETDMDFGLDELSADSPWSQQNGDLFSESQVKLEPLSPASSCSNSSSSSSQEALYLQQPQNTDDVAVVKIEDPPTPPYMCGDVLSPSLNNVQISIAPKAESVPSMGRQLTPCKFSTDLKADTILASKPAIQPKPLVVTAVPVPATSSPAKTILLQSVQPGGNTVKPQPLPIKPAISVSTPHMVLSQNDLLRLPVPGLIKVDTPVISSSSSKPGNNSCGSTLSKPATKNIVPIPTQTGSNSSEVDVKLLKRQQRMIKNRESACQSRKKKKEYLQGLESRLQEALIENEQLKRENAMLKKKLDAVISENAELRFGSGNRKAVCVMVVLLFIAFSFGPVSLTERKSEAFSQETDGSRIGRHLLAFKQSHQAEREADDVPEKEETVETRFRNFTTSFSDMKDLMLRDIDRFFLSADCRQFNKTESLRLADELRGWVYRHQIDRKKSRDKPGRGKKPAKSQKSQHQKKMPHLPSYIPLNSPENTLREASSQLQLYHSPEQSKYDFMEAIDRREDTFYVVSFRRDHLLLPAISHNKTSRPKMSLVMPAISLNDTRHNNSRDYELMMQIDCEVMDTRIIQIKSSTVPPFLRQQRDNHTAPLQPPSSTSGSSAHGPSIDSMRRIRSNRFSGHRQNQPLYLSEDDGV
ncbi:cyclic AMP-dependent transcription factor ATF-6 beta-like [Protopterus annectens]|uniref:cyclic AMP-dependent transcription factor ATF-6 beta-like n=1 Tax=Protopterus annectens TaxID=7888 RepID=UPI001CFADB23|nr:cyclic AMP-dependent transcription factor ATF-6 beta-like [Protopterus annectens]